MYVVAVFFVHHEKVMTEVGLDSLNFPNSLLRMVDLDFV